MSTPFPIISEAYRQISSQIRYSSRPDLYATADELAQNRKKIAVCVLWAEGGVHALAISANTAPSSGTSMSMPWMAMASQAEVAERAVNASTDLALSRCMQGDMKALLTWVDKAQFAQEETSSTGSPSFAEVAAADGSTTVSPPEIRKQWLTVAYELSQKGQGRPALRVIFAAVENYIAQHDFDALDSVLGGVDLSKLNPQTMTGLLRVASRVRRKLPNWEPLLNKVKIHLGRLPIANARALLNGLDS